ncbi:MAG: quinone-dependent dihydroorotate dehydrogenase [Candidatus Thalassarchaeaceae archaeon]|nr:quinone-dependent dihydroorotate dehydrogenase [Candidatus Thalassarchaeaceae archaeon]
MWRVFARPMMAILPLSSETMHSLVMKQTRFRCAYIPGYRRLLRMMFGAPSVPTDAFGIHFDNPVGLAAGMDKKGENIPNWENFGFGWIEIGGITLHAQEGNPKPRMFRSTKHGALINRMGFNNPGSEVMSQSLAKQKAKKWASVPVGINLGKSKITPNEEAEQDYSGTMERLWEFADLFVVNVSSPNTPNLRELQAGSELDRILIECNEVNSRMAQASGTNPKPILVKVSPDLSDDQLRTVADSALAQGCAGIVATNTTTSRPAEDKVMNQSGGLSGLPLRSRSTEVIHMLYAHTKGALPIVGVGGISDAESAWEKIGAGASILQLYSALIFEGPGVNKAINKGLNRKLKANGYQSLTEAVGHAHRS